MFEPLNYIQEPERANIPAADEPAMPPKRTLPYISKTRAIVASAVFLAFALFLWLFIFPPHDFPENSMVLVENGETLSGLTNELYERELVKSPLLFKTFSLLFGGGIKAGDYYMESKENAIILAWRFSRSSYNLKNIRVTIPEGTNSSEIAAIFDADSRFTHFDPVAFEKTAGPKEGYLFPDTYLFLPNVTASTVADTMLNNYERKMSEIREEMKLFGKSESDVIKMASIVEEEARTDESRKIIAGILWKRLKEGMPLQVDAAFVFVNGKKDSALLTLDDLKVDSPYNTYVHKGLPPTPISNPGLHAIQATIRPIRTPYYFYLSDKEGAMHYAVTHDEHVANKDKYLR